MVRIIDYEDRHAGEFREMNLEWLDQYHLTESHDLEVLDDPRGTILDQGGFICLAEADGEVVGSLALIPEPHAHVYELAKMFVRPTHRGLGISRMLMDRCLEKARELGARQIILWSNSQLQTAIRLYGQYGFRHVPVENSPFVTADVKMELTL